LKNHELNIDLKIENIKKIDYSEKSHLIFENGTVVLDDASIGLLTALNFSAQEKYIDVILKVDFYKNISEKRYDLFSIKTSNIFKILNYNEVIHKDSDEKFTVPNGLMRLLFDVSISNTRGMLAVLNTKPEYSKLVLPLFGQNKIKSILKANLNKTKSQQC